MSDEAKELREEAADSADGVTAADAGADGEGRSVLVPRVVGLDVGDRRIGVAISDGLGYTAQPLFTLPRTGRKGDLRKEVKWIGRLMRKHGATEVVVGNPLHMSGDHV